MCNAKSLIIMVAAAIAWVPALTVFGQDDKQDEWVRKSEETRARMKQLAETIKARAKELGGSELDKAEQELDKADDALDKEIEALDKIWDRISKAQDVPFKAQEELSEAREALYKASSEDWEKESQQAEDERHQATERSDQVRKELESLTKALDYKAGDEVIALRATELKIPGKTVAAVRKGDKLTVEQVQDKWLWVRSGNMQGWTDRRSVIGAALMDWYRRLPEGQSVDAAGQTRAKFRGILFEIQSAGSKGMTVTFNVDYADPCTIAFYNKVMVFVEGRRGDGPWDLHLDFDHPGVLVGSPPFPAASKGTRYATIVPGDYVFISAAARQVFVNGQLQKPKQVGG